MKIAVCVKVIKGEINPFDCSALECALSLCDDVTVISMGPPSAKEVLLPLTRLGAKVILVSDPLYAGSDTLATSYILSRAISRSQYDLILCGRQSVDGDTAQVGPMLSQRLGLELITGAMKVEVESGVALATTRFGREEAKLPALVTVERGYVLRFPSIFSKVGQVEILDNSTLLCEEEKCGLAGSPTRVLESYENQTGKRKCQFIPMSQLESLVADLRGREKETEIKEKDSDEKLGIVWAVGKEVFEKAGQIGKEVKLFENLSPRELSQKAKEEAPAVILFNGDYKGRKEAPIVAASLETGLCADCTKLEVSDGELYMYRPALGGSLIAKIKCLTKPVMATVRTKVSSSDIVVSLGRGAKGSLEKGKELAKRLNASLGASRGLVDENLAPYENQVGLTGKTIGAKIYIAIGISGAVHHTCAIEGVDTVIAINPDKDARIFEYADYGIIAEF